MAKLSAISSAGTRALNAINLTKGVLAINAGSAATIKTTNALTYILDGTLYSKTALSAVALAAIAGPAGSSFYVQPASTTVYYVICLDSAGTVKTVQGSYSGQALGTNAGGMTAVGDGNVPDIDSTTYVPIGMIKIVTNSSTTFTPATTALDAAGLTVTFTDLAMLPATDRP